MQEELRSLVESPTAENYRRVRAQLLAAADGGASLGDLAALGAACETRRWTQAARLVARMWRPWLLSPRVHYFAALVAEARGDAADAELERCLFTTCLDAMLATGRGDERSPYLVTYLSDVNDLVAARKLHPLDRRVVETGEGYCDVVRCRGDRTVWCDVSELVLRTGLTVVQETLDQAPLTVAAPRRIARKALSHR